MATQQDPVIILGAGISGLAFGQSLLKRNIPFRIYERDHIFNQRAQGYRVRINGIGIAALKACLTPDLYARLEKCCAIHVGGTSPGPVWKLDALTAEKHTGPPMGTLPKVENAKGPSSAIDKTQLFNVEPLNADRSVLRSVLMYGLEPYVEFGKDFASYETTSNGVKVLFADGSQVQGCLLVGADGAGSKVRKQLVPDARLVDTEGRFIYGKTTLTPQLEVRLQPKCLQGMSIVQDTTNSQKMTLLLEPVRFKDNEHRKDLPDDYIYWVLLARKDSYPMDDAKLLNLSNAECAALTYNITAHWHPSFQALFDQQDASKTAMLRIISAQPNLATWDSDHKVTLIGDAVHVMSPTAGVGATTALRDAATLSELLQKAGKDEISDFAAAVAGYEDTMRVYAKEALLGGQMGGKHIFGMRPYEEMEEINPPLNKSKSAGRVAEVVGASAALCVAVGVGGLAWGLNYPLGALFTHHSA